MHNLQLALLGVISSVTLTAVYLISKLNPFVQKNQSQKRSNPGVVNIGNTCFVSSTLQALSTCSLVHGWHTPSQVSLRKQPRRDRIGAWLQRIVEHSDVNHLLAYQLSHALRVLNNLTPLNLSSYHPLPLFFCLSSHGWSIPQCQHDAFEFFHILLQSLYEEALKTPYPVSHWDLPAIKQGGVCIKACHNNKNNKINNNNNDHTIKSNDNDNNNGNKSSNFNSIITPLLTHPFRGRFHSQLICKNCLKKTPARYDSFEGVTLHLPNKNGVASIKEMLTGMVGVEVVVMNCEACKKKGDFFKKTTFAKLPDILCFQIQRTMWSLDGPYKRDDHVCFPDHLNMSPYVSLCHSVPFPSLLANKSGVGGNRGAMGIKKVDGVVNSGGDFNDDKVAKNNDKHVNKKDEGRVNGGEDGCSNRRGGLPNDDNFDSGVYGEDEDDVGEVSNISMVNTRKTNDFNTFNDNDTKSTTRNADNNESNGCFMNNYMDNKNNNQSSSTLSNNTSNQNNSKNSKHNTNNNKTSNKQTNNSNGTRNTEAHTQQHRLLKALHYYHHYTPLNLSHHNKPYINTTKTNTNYNTNTNDITNTNDDINANNDSQTLDVHKPSKLFFSSHHSPSYAADVTSLADEYKRDQIQTGGHGYRLMAVVVHLGSVASGHFITFKRTASRLGVRFPNRWLMTSDEEVKSVPSNVVFNSPAYMLFYERI